MVPRCSRRFLRTAHWLRLDLDVGTGHQPELPIGNNPFSGLQTAFNYRDVSRGPGYLDRTGCHGLRRINHTDRCPLPAGQDRHGRDRECILLYVELGTYAHELARPESTVGIVETAFEQDRAGAAIHCIVHEDQPPFYRYAG